MTDITYEELKKKTVAEMRAIAKEMDHEAVKGYSQMKKDILLAAICEAQGLQMVKKKKAAAGPKPKVVGSVKDQIKVLKQKRDEILASDDKTELKAVRRRIHRLKRLSRRAAGAAAA